MTNNLMEYKGYHTRIEFDSEDMILHGKIEGINDLVTFESDSIDRIAQEFHDAVDDYLEYCAQIGKSPDREFKGSFNIRLTPQMHKDAFYKAFRQGLSLNSYIFKTLEKDLYGAEPTANTMPGQNSVQHRTALNTNSSDEAASLGLSRDRLEESDNKNLSDKNTGNRKNALPVSPDQKEQIIRDERQSVPGKILPFLKPQAKTEPAKAEEKPFDFSREISWDEAMEGLCI